MDILAGTLFLAMAVLLLDSVESSPSDSRRPNSEPIPPHNDNQAIGTINQHWQLIEYGEAPPPRITQSYDAPTGTLTRVTLHITADGRQIQFTNSEVVPLEQRARFLREWQAAQARQAQSSSPPRSPPRPPPKKNCVPSIFPCFRKPK
ncbi:uncharacterized protein LOC117171627 [Belonocnema kinseyi]|uniref:uncharacterized protein LOC117171627 n=1 Tax=Belonocnema kinseyi TaxID=2817044 RepID=UPI00143CC8EA|nr:uncharacterized protein LOC117171627 [Belonocnema kinseyi]